MKRIIGCSLAFVFALSLISLSSPADAQAQRPPGSVGIGIGSATGAAGVSLKTGMGSFTFQGVAGTWRGHGVDWGFRGDTLGLAADFLYEMPTIASGQVVALGWNYGLGAGVGIGDVGAAIGGTGVIGLEFNFQPAPIDFVVEYRPGIYIGNDDLDLEFVDFTGHLRFWF